MAAREQPRYAFLHRASWEVPVTTGPQDPAAAGRDRLRAGHADREQVIEALKDAFVHGRLTRDELGTRAGQALAARTYADLAVLTADIPPAPAAPARPPARARRRPLARAAAQSSSCLIIAFASLVFGGTVIDPDVGPKPYYSWAPLTLLVAMFAVLAALGFLVYGVDTAVEQRRSRGQLPPRPGPGGHALDSERRGGTGHDRIPPDPGTDPTRAGLRAHKSRQHRQHMPARAGRAARGARPAPGAA
jgi:hypothetical protein